MAKIRQSSPSGEVERVVRCRRGRIIYLPIALSLLFAVISLILWFYIPTNVSIDGQVAQVSIDISKVLSANEFGVVTSDIFESLGSDMALYASIITSLITMSAITWPLIKGDGFNIELLFALVVVTTGFSVFRTLYDSESDRYTYYSEKVSSAMEDANKFPIWDHHTHPRHIPEGHHEPSTRLHR